MQILTADQVNYCDIVPTGGTPDTIEPGIQYHGKLFIRREFYSKAQHQEAIQAGRKAFLDLKAKTLFLVVEEPTGYTLWQEDNGAKLANPLAGIDLDMLATRMRGPDGVEICDRQYSLNTYSSCFVGSEAVIWLVQHLKLSKPQAMQLGQQLVEAKLIHHVLDQHDFEDDYLFYRFYMDE